MSVLLVLLAIPGIAAVLLRWSAAAFHTARHSIEWFVARQISDNRAARGDISGMTEAETIRRDSRAKQAQGLLLLGLWTGALLIPLIVPGTLIVYALYGLLWLAPMRRAANGAP